MDEQRMKLVDFEKVWSNWTKRFDAFEAEAREIEEKIQAYDRTHRTIKQMQSQLEQLLERLERRITEVSEMQRLSDERMKQDWAAFEADETKKWSTFKLSSEERWKEHQRVHEKLSDVISELELLKTEIRTDLDELMERETQKVNQILELARQWIKDLK
jgi:chromosome segregation ATPase